MRATTELPVVVEGDMSRQDEQRKHGTTDGSPRPVTHSEGIAYKVPGIEIAMCLSGGGWGRISVEGAGQHNPHRSEDPGVERVIRLHGGA